MSKERRQYQRVPLGAAVSFQELRFQGAQAPAEAAYRDVSGGGLLLASPREVPLGTLLRTGWQHLRCQPELQLSQKMSCPSCC